MVTVATRYLAAAPPEAEAPEWRWRLERGRREVLLSRASLDLVL